MCFVKRLLVLPFCLVFTSALAGEPELLAALENPDPAVRSEAATAIRELLDAGQNEVAPGNVIEHERAYWEERVAGLRRGLNRIEIAVRLGIPIPSVSSGMYSGGSGVETWPLDRTFSVTLSLIRRSAAPSKPRIALGLEDNGYTLVKATLAESPRSVWVKPAEDFTGQWETYFVTGQPANRIDYADGKYHGEFIAYRPTGGIRYRKHYQHGVCTGKDEGFYPSGKPSYTGEYANGKRVGKWEHFREDGRLRHEQNFDAKGLRDGPSRRWNERGIKTHEIIYREDRELGQAAWNDDGVLQYDRRPAR